MQPKNKKAKKAKTPSKKKRRDEVMKSRPSHPFNIYRVGRLAQLFDVSPETIWRWYAVDHTLPPPVVICGIRGWTEEQVAAVLKQQLLPPEAVA